MVNYNEYIVVYFKYINSILWTHQLIKRTNHRVPHLQVGFDMFHAFTESKIMFEICLKQSLHEDSTIAVNVEKNNIFFGKVKSLVISSC